MLNTAVYPAYPMPWVPVVRFVGFSPSDRTSGTFQQPYSQIFPAYDQFRNSVHPDLVGISAREMPSFITPFQKVLDLPLSGIDFNKSFQRLDVPTNFNNQIASLNGGNLTTAQLRSLFAQPVDLSQLNPYKEPNGKFTQVVPFVTPQVKTGDLSSLGYNNDALGYLNIAEKFTANVYPAFRIGYFYR